MSDNPGDATYAYIGAFVDELARSGVRNVCVAPGSRSAPLAISIAQNSSLKTWMHVDERSAAFFALGMARALDEPVALLCTSGTAASNFFPAIVEAKSAGIPLVVLTADRPPELRDVGAAQTIDQNRLYGSHVKWFVEVALPDATVELMRYARTLAGRATAMATAIPAGPVHLNFPLREPLVPESSGAFVNGGSVEFNGRANGAPWVRVSDSRAALEDRAAERVAARLASANRPLFICGPQHDVSLAPVIAELACAVGAPILADPVSQLRWGDHDRTHVVDRYDSILRHHDFANDAIPDLVVRIGGAPTSKTLIQYLTRNASVPLIVIDEARWPDPTLLAEEILHAHPRWACEQLLGELENSDTPLESDSCWVEKWSRANTAAHAAMEQYTCSLSEAFEGRALADVVSVLPDSSTLFVSSSMPIRDLDAFGAGDSRRIRVLANRGANGIDGVISSALGAAAALRESSGGPIVLVIGDLAFYHDMNGLLAAKLYELDATIVILNNDGGGIFSFLPQAEHRDHFEQIFGTPHGLDFEPVAALYGATFSRAHDAATLSRAVAAGIAGKGLHLVEIKTDRERNVVLHREAWAAVAAALDTL